MNKIVCSKKAIYYRIANLDLELIIQLNHASHFWQIKFLTALMRVYLLKWCLIDLQKVFGKTNHVIIIKNLKTMWFSEGCIMVSSISFWKYIFYKHRKPTFWLWKNIVWCSTGLDPRAFAVPYLCQWHALSHDSNLLLYADDSCIMFQHKGDEAV